MPTELPIVFRLDASSRIGGGHLMRSSALAAALGRRGKKCVLAAAVLEVRAPPGVTVTRLRGGDELATLRRQFPEGAAWLVVDHYERGAHYERAARGWAKRVMAIDDRPYRPHDVDLLLDVTLGRAAAAYSALVPKRCHVLTGAAHALLRRQFAEHRDAALARRAAATGVERLLISAGAGDIRGLTSLLVRAAAAWRRDVATDVVVMSSWSSLEEIRGVVKSELPNATLHENVTDMAALMARADLALGTAGVTTWERCTVGLPSIAVVASDNQRDIAAALEARGAGLSAGWHADATVAGVAASIERLAARLAEASRAAASICDGLGAERVAETLLAFA